MFIELISSFAAGFAGAGVIMILRHLTRGAVPRYMIPICAGLAMISFMVWSEYSWRDRMIGALPGDIVELRSHSEPSLLRPWTYLYPFATRFSAVDLASIRRHEATPDQMMINVFLFARRAPVRRFPILVDCAGGRRADVVDGVDFADDGSIVDPDWRLLPEDDVLLETACAGESAEGDR